MSSTTYLFENKISKALNLDCIFCVTDQQLRTIPKDAVQDYVFIPTPKQRIEINKSISEACKGRVAWNKGVPNPTAKERMLTNNPMKNPEIAKKVSEANKGNKTPRPPARYGKDGRKKTLWIYPDGTEKIITDTRKECDRLGISYSSMRHKIDDGPYKKGKYKGLEVRRLE